ncbi:hypothetical protein TrRE_jg1420, partial [Triparma retinervis]
MVISTSNFKHQIDSLNDIMARLSSEKASLESSYNQSTLLVASLSSSNEKLLKESRQSRTGIEKEKRQRQSSVIKLAEVMQQAKASSAEIKKRDSEMAKMGDVISRLVAEKEMLEERVMELNAEMGAMARRPKPSEDSTVNALQEARRGQDEALSIVMKEKEELEAALERERGEREEERRKAEGEHGKVVKEMERSVKEKAAEVLDLKKGLSMSSVKLAEHASVNSRLQKTLSACKASLDSALKNSMASEAASLLAKVGSLSGEVLGAKLANKGLAQEAAIHVEEMQQVSEELREAKKEVRRLGELVEGKDGVIMQERGESGKWKEAVDVMKSRVGKLVERVREVEGETRGKIEEIGGGGKAE